MHTNRLAQERSPYLLQHAHNPVDWHPWGDAAFDKARGEDKPIFLSIGYSTCHWCHVMERESFESEEIAEILNRYFVPVKVDREERPDVDRIYMAFIQASSGGGGWPMSVFLTPDLKPFFGGTYFPPDNRYGRPGFKYLLEHLAATWQRDRARIVESSAQAIEQLRQMTTMTPGLTSFIEPGAVDSAFYFFRRTFDSSHGGFGDAPKFPRPSVFNFLLRYYKHSGNEEALDMTLKTLRAMARGGMNDQLAGGFHRYSVDARWFVPHFEKMLYDQAQLALSFTEAWQITRNEELARTARETLDYVLRDMTDSGGGFHSAEDADSVIDPEKPEEKGEGAFYVWTASELRDVLGEPLAASFAERYGVEEEGNVHEDPHGEFTGRNILYQARELGDAVSEEAAAGIARTRSLLLDARARRVRPHLDDKVLTAWNALMISAFAKAAQAFGDTRYLLAAQRAARFLRERMYAGGNLLRRYREGDAAIPGFLDDYAFFAQAMLDLYEADFDPANLRLAEEIAVKMRERFEDTEHGGFFSTTEGDPSLVLRIKEDYDGAEPSGNSIAALALLRLARILGRSDFRESAERTLRAFSSRLSEMPAAIPQMLVALLLHLQTPKQIVIAGGKQEAAELLATVRGAFLPFHSILFADAGLPQLAQMQAAGTAPLAYVCEDFTCRMPTGDARKLAELLQ